MDGKRGVRHLSSFAMPRSPVGVTKSLQDLGGVAIVVHMTQYAVTY